MAITASGIYLDWFNDTMNNDVASDLDLETHKGGLKNDTWTPNFNTDTSWNTTNEVSGGAGWPSGGVALTTTLTDITTTSGTFIFDGENVQQTPTDLSAAMCYILYADAITGPPADPQIVLVDFVSAVNTTNGQLDITWADLGSGGIFNIDLTPP